MDEHMRTVSEIEDAIARLPRADREALENRLLSQRFGSAALGIEKTELIVSMDEAELEIESGNTVSGDDLRRDIRTWLGNRDRYSI